MLALDANIAIKLVALEPGRDAVLARLDDEKELIAPDWLLVEVGQVLWRKARLKELDRYQAEAGLAAIPAYFESLVPAVSLFISAQKLAFELDHWVYDCIYLATALDQKARLLTADRKFANSANRAGYGSNIELLTWRGQAA
jgi:predicted nucleic acid-binding protein